MPACMTRKCFHQMCERVINGFIHACARRSWSECFCECAAQIVNISSTLGSIGEEAKFLKENPEENNTRVMASNAVGYRASKAALNASEYCATN
jgi:NAD(P)-dependent dehydrogenase (short-subunit alcohol dehydrogenase family)